MASRRSSVCALRVGFTLSALLSSLLAGCGGGQEDFGPTRTFTAKSAGTTTNADSSSSNAAATTAPGAPAAAKSSPDAEPPATAAQSPGQTVPKADAKTESSAEAANPAAQESKPTNAKSPNAVAKNESKDAAIRDAIAPQSTPQQSDAPTPAKSDGATPNKSDSAASGEPVARQPLSMELREWLLAKRRQAVSRDGLWLLTAADFSKLSLHDLRTGQLSRELFGSADPVSALAIAPQREWVVGAAEAGWVRLWTLDVPLGMDRFARDVFRATQASQRGIDTEQNGVWSLVLSPKSDWVLTGGEDGTLRKTLVQPANAASDTDGDAAHQPLARWTLTLGDKVEAHSGTVTALDVSADVAWAVSGGTDQAVRLWNSQTLVAVQTWSEMATPISDVAVSANGKVVAAAGTDKAVRWWSVEAESAGETKSPDQSTKDANSQSDDNSATTSAADKETKKPASMKSGKAGTKEKDAKPQNLLEHPGVVRVVAVSPDGRLVATGCQDKIVRVWNLATRQVVEKYEGLKDAVVEVRFVDGDKKLFFRDRSGIAILKPRARRDSNDDDIIQPPEAERPIQFATPASLLSVEAVAGRSATEELDNVEVVQWLSALRNANSREARVAARQELLKATLGASADDPALKAAQVAALEKQLATATSDSAKADLKRQISRLKTVAVSQERTEQPKLLGTLTTAFPFQAGASVQLSLPGDGELLLATAKPSVRRDDDGRRQSSLSPGQLWVWDTATQQPLRHWDKLPTSVDAAWFVDSTSEFVASNGDLFCLPTGLAQTVNVGVSERISALAVSPNGKTIAVGSVGVPQAATKVLRLVDATTHQELQALEAFEGWVTAVTFAPDGTSLAVAVRERQRHRLLILSASTFEITAIIEEPAHSSPWLQGGATTTQDRGLTTLVFSADGRSLVTHGSYGSEDYRLTLWTKKTGKWLKDASVSSKANQPLIDDARTPSPLWFVGGRSTQLAAVTSKGLGIVDTSNGRLVRSVELRDGFKNRDLLTWSADGTWLAQGDEAGQVTLWNLRSEKEGAYFSAQLGPLKSLALAHDGRLLATLGEENKLHLWNLESWVPKNRIAAKPKTTKSTASE